MHLPHFRPAVPLALLLVTFVAFLALCGREVMATPVPVDLSNTTWYTVGKTRVHARGRSAGGAAGLEVRFDDSGGFLAIDDEGLELSGTCSQAGKRNQKLSGDIDAGSLSVLEQALEDALSIEVGGNWTATTTKSTLHGKVNRSGTTMKVTVKLVFELHESVLGRTLRVRETLKTRGGM